MGDKQPPPKTLYQWMRDRFLERLKRKKEKK